MPDVRIPEELAERLRRQHQSRTYTPKPGEKFALPEVLDCIEAQLQPGYRVGNVKAERCRLPYVRVNDGDEPWHPVLEAGQGEPLSDEIAAKLPIDTGLNVRDLVEHLQKGPVVCLTERQIESKSDAELTTLLMVALKDWRERQKP